CNPTPPACNNSITAHNDCGAVDVICTPGDVVVDGCNRSQTFDYSATACGFTSHCFRTFTWTESGAPVFDNCTDGSTPLGCNPTPPACNNSITAHNDCGAVDVICTPGDVVVDGCNRS